jgi:hypothetical protein
MTRGALSSQQFAGVPAPEVKERSAPVGWDTFWPEPLIKNFKDPTPPGEQKWSWRRGRS